MNTYKLLVIFSFIFLSCAVRNNTAVSDTDALDEREIARHNRLDSIQKITVAKQLKSQKITTPPKTLKKKVESKDGQN